MDRIRLKRMWISARQCCEYLYIKEHPSISQRGERKVRKTYFNSNCREYCNAFANNLAKSVAKSVNSRLTTLLFSSRIMNPKLSPETYTSTLTSSRILVGRRRAGPSQVDLLKIERLSQQPDYTESSGGSSMHHLNN